MKEKPVLYLAIIVGICAVAFVPNIQIAEASGITFIPLVNVIIGLVSPVLVIAFGVKNIRKEDTKLINP